jgi:hypothetical protein
VRIVLDECVNPRVERLLQTDHAVFTVLGLGWGGLPDNILVERLQGKFDVFLTIDQGFEHEHNLSSLGFGIVIVHPFPPRGRGWTAVPIHFIGGRAAPSPAEGLWTLRAHSSLRPAGG